VPRRKTESVITTVEEAFKEASTEASDLAGEIQEWQDGMHGTNLENTSKYEEVSGTASALDELRDRLEEMELPEPALRRVCQYTWVHPYGRSISRSWRASHVAQALRAVAEGIVHEQDVEDTYSELCDIADTIESVEFPTMYS